MGRVRGRHAGRGLPLGGSSAKADAVAAGPFISLQGVQGQRHWLQGVQGQRHWLQGVQGQRHWLQVMGENNMQSNSVRQTGYA